MSERQTIIGLTEAELGFFLFALFLVLFLVLYAAPEEPPADELPSVAIPADSLNRLIAELDSLRTMVDTLSVLKPNCTERELIEGPLFSVVILGQGRFRIGADTVDTAEIERQFGNELREARRVGCFHQVRVSFIGTLPAPSYQADRFVLAGLGLRLITTRTPVAR